jgi:hypothetical protein
VQPVQRAQVVGGHLLEALNEVLSINEFLLYFVVNKTVVLQFFIV